MLARALNGVLTEASKTATPGAVRPQGLRVGAGRKEISKISERGSIPRTRARCGVLGIAVLAASVRLAAFGRNSGTEAPNFRARRVAMP